MMTVSTRTGSAADGRLFFLPSSHETIYFETLISGAGTSFPVCLRAEITCQAEHDRNAGIDEGTSLQSVSSCAQNPDECRGTLFA